MSQAQPTLSIISPIYHAEKFVVELVKQISDAASKITPHFEIILVNDASPDKSWEEIEKVCAVNKQVIGINFTRNFGQHCAITAGLRYCKGDYAVVLDCDLQDDPKYIIDMFNKAQEGFDIVFTRKQDRSHSISKNFFSKAYHMVINLLSNPEVRKDNKETGSFSLISRRAIDMYLNNKSIHDHYINLLKWSGYPAGYVDIIHRERPSGKSSYTFAKSVNLAITGIITQTSKLLYISVFIGFFFAASSVLLTATLIVLHHFQNFQAGWTSLATLILFSTGLILFFTGILGIYIGKIYEQTQNRPLFFVKEALNLNLSNPMTTVQDNKTTQSNKESTIT